jgi:hypothetical protein
MDNELGRVHWQGLAPRAQVALALDGRPLRGLGYAERLTLTVPPWRLPLRHLRWGRFVGPHASLIWMDWQGPYQARFAFLNGAPCALRKLSAEAVEVEGARLEIGEGKTLRGGRLGETILPQLPALGRLLPASLAGIEETKWLAPGELECNGNTEPGWVIHEVVAWHE